MFRELPFAIREHDVVVHGIIERLVFFCQDGRVLSADILDFKSDTLSVGTPLGCRKQSRNISRKWLCIAKPLLVSSDLTSAILPHDFFSYSLGRCNGLRLDCTQSEANKTLSDAMNIVHITQAALDTILALQLMVAWAGEGL